MRQLIAGNWKMHGTSVSLAEIEALAGWLGAARPPVEVMIFPPATLLSRAAALADGRLVLGAQDCHPDPSGAFTGDLSAEMLRDAGAAAVILGHSERRQRHGETDALVAAKVHAAWRAGLMAIVCVGESESERRNGAAADVVAVQVARSIPDEATGANTAIAYEPVWAIGSGKTPTFAEIAEMHAHIGRSRGGMRILYGGSVKPDNAEQILALPGVGGALVGGASLRALDFERIIAAARAKL